MKKQAFLASVLSGITAVSAAVLLAPDLVNAGTQAAPAAQGAQAAQTVATAAQIPATTVAINATNFPDETFREYVKTLDDGDNKLTDAERNAVTQIKLVNKGITSLTGIEYFENLTSLLVWGNDLSALNVSKNLNLTELNCSDNKISTLNVSANTALTSLSCAKNNLDKLVVTKNTALEKLNCGTNNIETLTLTKNKELRELDCKSNPISSLSLLANTKLMSLNVSGLALTELDLSKNTLLESFVCDGIKVTSLDFSAMSYLKDFVCYSAPECTSIVMPTNRSKLGLVYVNNTKITTLDLSGASYLYNCRADTNSSLTKVILTDCTNLKELYLNEDPKLTTLQAASLPSLNTLYCRKSGFTKLDLSAYTGLNVLSCSGCKFTSLDLTKNIYLHTLLCSQEYSNTSGATKIKVLNVTGLDELSTIECEYNDISVLDTSNKNLYSLKCRDNNIKKLDLSSSTDLSELYCDDNALTSLDISASTNLRYVRCNGNQITTLKIPATSQATGFECNDNKVKSLDFSKYTHLGYLTCENNALTTLKLKGATSLDTVHCGNNALTSLDVSGCSRLTYLSCEDNELTSLVLTGATKLQTLTCSGNNLTKLKLSDQKALDVLQCEVNALTALDVSNCPELRLLDCYANNIKTINIDNCPILIKAAQDLVDFFSTHYNDIYYEYVAYIWDENRQIKGCIETDYTTGIVSKSLTPTPTPLAKPSNLKAVVESPTTIRISWNAIPGAETYMINYIGMQGNICVDYNRDYIYTENPNYLFEDMVPGTTYEFTVWATYNNPRFANPTAKITVETPSLTDITVEIGKTYKYEVPGVSSSSIQWSVGNTSVATVDESGIVTGKSFGNTYLYAKKPDGTTIRCLVRVVYPPLKINYTEKTLHINQTFAFTTANACGQKITWSVGNTSVATVDANGKVTGKSAANTYLYAKSADGRTAKCLVKVIDPGTLGINYTEKTIFLGQSFTFTAKNAGILKPTWSVGNTAIATVNSSTGKVTSVSEGNTYLYVKTADGRSARCLVKVVDPGPLNIRYSEKTIKVGATFKFTCSNPAGQTVTWKVGNTGVATVDANGNVTGKSVGNTWLYARTPDGRTTKCLVKIVA